MAQIRPTASTDDEVVKTLIDLGYEIVYIPKIKLDVSGSITIEDIRFFNPSNETPTTDEEVIRRLTNSGYEVVFIPKVKLTVLQETHIEDIRTIYDRVAKITDSFNFSVIDDMACEVSFGGITIITELDFTRRIIITTLKSDVGLSKAPSSKPMGIKDVGAIMLIIRGVIEKYQKELSVFDIKTPSVNCVSNTIHSRLQEMNSIARKCIDLETITEDMLIKFIKQKHVKL